MTLVREAAEQDAAAIASLMTTLGYETSAEEMRRRLQAVISDGHYVSLVALDGDRVLGFLGLAFGLYYEYTGSYARIVALSVAPEAQGQGVGKTLVAVAEDTARRRGALTCIVNSGLQRAEAHRFYENVGFSWKGKAFYQIAMSARAGRRPS